MNLNSSKHRLLVLPLNVSVPDQSEDICNKISGSTTRGEEGAEIPGKGRSRAPGVMGEGGAEPWVTSPCCTSTAVTISEAELIIQFSCSDPFLHRLQGCKHSSIRILRQAGGWEELRSEIQGKTSGCCGFDHNDLYWRQVGSFIIQK